MPIPIADLKQQYKRLLEGGAAAMTIADADMADGIFGGEWLNLTFTNCNFAGEDNIQLSGLRNCQFVGCNFLAPAHDFGIMTDVIFTQCTSQGHSVFGGGDGSRGVVFEHCNFHGHGVPAQSFEGIGCTGEIVFRHCSGSGQTLVAGTHIRLEHCNFDNMNFMLGRPLKRGLPLACVVEIDDCEGTGVWCMASGRLKSSRIDNSSFHEIVYDKMEGELD